MHEMSIAENIFEITNEYLKKEPEKRLLSVTVEVGELTAVVPESLEFCFSVILQETEHSSAKLIIKNVPLTANCRQCGKEFPIKNLVFNCPFCRSPEVKVIKGNELRVTELEVE